MTYSHFFFWFVLSMVLTLWKFSMYFLKFIEKQKARCACLLLALRFQKKTILSGFFHFCFYLCSDSAVLASFPNLIWKLVFVVLLGNLVFNCIFLSDSSPSVHINAMENGGGLASHRRLSCLAWTGYTFSTVWNWKINLNLQISKQGVSWQINFRANQSCRN